MSTPHAQRFALDIGWRFLLKALGISAREVLRRAELPDDIFSRSNAALDPEAYFRFWTTLHKVSKDPVFPLSLAKLVSAEAFSPPIFAALCSPNFAVAMDRLSQFKPLVGPLRLSVDHSDKTTTLKIDCLYTEHPVPLSLLVSELIFMVRIARLGTQEHVVPLKATMPEALEEQAQYEEFLGVKVTRARQLTLVFSAEDARLPFYTENAGMWDFFEPVLRERLSQRAIDESFAHRVRGILLEALPSGQHGVDEIAQRLAVSRRTLQRRLSEEKTSFQLELDAVREDLAKHYLANTAMPLAQIAFLIGFEDPNSFIRAFQQWTGMTPEAARQKGSLR